MKITIRAGTLDDLETIVRHRLGMFRDMGTPEDQVAPMDGPARSYFRRAIPDGSYRPFLAQTEDGCVIAGGGIVILHWPASPRDPYDSRAMILNMYTEREFRRRGIARGLMERMLAWCRENEYKTVSLHASGEGRPLYE